MLMLRFLTWPGAMVLAVASASISALGGEATSAERPGQGGRIVGRVMDSAGRSIPGVFVSAMVRVESGTGRPDALQPVDVRLHSITDAHGEFVLADLKPGLYSVVGIPRNPPTDPKGLPNRRGFGITYHPGSSSARDARAVLVNSAVAAQANITLIRARLSVVAGLVTTSNGQSARKTHLRIAHGNGLFGLDTRTISTRADGTFSISGLPPGSYFFHVGKGRSPLEGDVSNGSVATVVLEGDDRLDVRVEPSPGSDP
jgi:hypothetical protein